MPKKKRTVSEENKLAAKQRMEAYWAKRRRQEMALLPIKGILDSVYLAGWKHNKAKVINTRVEHQRSPEQAEAELKKLFMEAFNA